MERSGIKKARAEDPTPLVFFDEIRGHAQINLSISIEQQPLSAAYVFEFEIVIDQLSIDECVRYSRLESMSVERRPTTFI